MTKLFKDLLLSEGGIYTLWGSKPITRIVVYHYSDEKIDEYLSSLTPEQRKQCRISNEEYDLPENWAKWEKVAHKYPLHRYLLFHVKDETDTEASFIYLINIFKTACVIQENYPDFKNLIGSDFDPLEAVLEMPSAQSTFLKKMNAYTWGLLFGYGKENALAFQWKHFTANEKTAKFLDDFQQKSSEVFITGQYSPSLKNLEIPSFFSFVENDPAVKKYKKEREKIRHLYQHSDFLETSLKRFTSQ